MSDSDIDKLRVIRNILDGRLTWNLGAAMLRLSERQIGRLCAAVRQEGNRGILHGLCGQPSNNRLDPELLGRALSALHNPLWEGFRPTFAQQKLDGFYDIVISDETVRKLMALTDIWRPRHRGSVHRNWRERRACVGMLTQLDGSPHDWLEGRGPWCTLIIYIDDATSRILYGEFVHVEDTLTLMRTTKTYLRRWGRPVAFYVDKDSIYNVNRQASVEEELRDEQPITQFTRAMGQLNIEVILAHSPQAKGRVERGFLTHQDRLVKELRLAGISTMEEANPFLWKVYIPDHNRRYARRPADPIDTHRPLLPSQDLKAILAIETPRQVQNDFTIRYKNLFFQLEPRQPVRVYKKAEITVQQRLDSSMHLVFKGQRLKFHQIPGRPLRTPQPSRRRTSIFTTAKRSHHRPFILNYATLNAARRIPMNPPASALLQT